MSSSDGEGCEQLCYHMMHGSDAIVEDILTRALASVARCSHYAEFVMLLHSAKPGYVAVELCGDAARTGRTLVRRRFVPGGNWGLVTQCDLGDTEIQRQRMDIIDGPGVAAVICSMRCRPHSPLSYFNYQHQHETWLASCLVAKPHAEFCARWRKDSFTGPETLSRRIPIQVGPMTLGSGPKCSQNLALTRGPLTSALQFVLGALRVCARAPRHAR